MATDDIQRDLDGAPSHDAEKGATLGGFGGAAVGAAVGSAAGPVGTVAGIIAGGLIGAGAMDAAVHAVDRHNHPHTTTPPPETVVPDADTPDVHASSDNAPPVR